MTETVPPVFSEYARYYDLLYHDKDYAGEVEYIDQLIRRFKPDAGSILELGSGTGKHAMLLAQRGYKIHGIERSEEMLESAQKLVAQGTPGTSIQSLPIFTKGDIRSARVEGLYDAVIALFHVISYQTTNDDLLAAFGTARAHLNKGGLFIFDAWYGPAVLTERPSVRVKRMSNEYTEITRIAEPVIHPFENTVDVNYNIFIRHRATASMSEIHEKHCMRYLFAPELKHFLAQRELNMIHSEEFMTGYEPTTHSWGICVIASAA